MAPPETSMVVYAWHAKTNARACLKNHSRNLHAPLCGIFCPNSVAVARYGALIRTKSPTNCDAHLAESLFQTRSRACLKNVLALVIIQTHREREYICVPHYRESPGEDQECQRDQARWRVVLPQAERGVHGADGRWLWRGAVEGDCCAGLRHSDRQWNVGCDRSACYSGRVWKYPVRFPRIRIPDSLEEYYLHREAGMNRSGNTGITRLLRIRI